jgi:hypothetical protein
MVILQRFWRGLELLNGLKTLPVTWRNLVGDEFDQLSYYIRPHGGLADAYPRFDNIPLATYYRIFSHSPDYHVGLCDVTGDRIELTTAEITNHEFDLQKLGRDLAQVLGFEWQWQPTDAYKTFRLGTYAAALNDRFPVFLTIQCTAHLFRNVVDRLAATTAGPFLLIAPTRHCCKPDSEALLRDKGSLLLPLCEVVALDDHKRLLATAGAQVLLHEFKERVFGARRPKNGSEGAYQYRLQGNAWLVAYDGKVAVVDDSRGMHFIAFLLANPGKSIHAEKLIEAVDGQAKPAGSTGAILDAQAQKAYQQRLGELEEEIDEAKRFADLARHERLCEEREKVMEELTAAKGLRGRRRATAEADRNRCLIKMALKRALTDLKNPQPELHQHLKCSLHTGHTLCYAPEAVLPWVL